MSVEQMGISTKIIILIINFLMTVIRLDMIPNPFKPTKGASRGWMYSIACTSQYVCGIYHQDKLDGWNAVVHVGGRRIIKLWFVDDMLCAQFESVMKEPIGRVSKRKWKT